MSYENWSRDELLEEIDRLRKKLDDKGELRDHIAQKIKIDTDLKEAWHADSELINKIFSCIAEFVYLVDFTKEKDRIIRFASPHIHHVYGIKREEYLNNASALVDRIHPDDLEKIKTELAKLFRDRIPTTYTYRFLHGVKNKYVWLEETIYPQINLQGEYSGNLGVIRDVSTRLEALEENRHSKESLEIILDQVNEVIYHNDFSRPQEERLIYLSKKVEEIIGVPYDDYIRDPEKYLKYVHPEDKENINRAINEQRRDGNPKTIQYRFLHQRKQEYVWLEEYILKTYSKTGELLKSFGIVRDITGRKESESRLKESEERFRMLAENATDVIFRYSMYPEPHYEYVSPSIEAMTGYTPEEFYSDPILGFRLIHPDDKSPFLHSQMVIEGKEDYGAAPPPGESYAVRWIKKDGSIIWTETRNRPIVDANGKPIAVEGISRDITQAKIAEQELMASREHYRKLIEQSPDGIIIFTLTGELITANRAAVKMLGGETENDFLEQNILNYVQPIHKEKVVERLKKAAAGESVPFEPLHAYTAKGEDLELETKPMRYNYMGKPAIIAFIRDVTVIRRMEKERLRLQVIEESNLKLQAEIQERIRTELQLFETKENLRQLIDSSLDMIIASDMSGFINEFNPAAERIFGYDRHEAIGMNLSSIYINEDERNRVVGNQLEKEGYFSGEIVNRKKNGEEFISFLSASVIRDNKGRVVGAMGISRDISDRIRYEKELLLREEKYRAVFDQAYTGIALVAVDGGRYMEVNETLCSMLGYERKDLLERSIHDLHLPGDLSRLPKGEDFIRRGFRHIVDEHRYLHRDGSTVFVSVTITLVRGDDNKPLYFVYVYEDLTPKRKAEEQLSIQAAKLNAIIESSSHIIWTIDRKHKLTSFNKNQADWIRKAYNVTPYIGMDMLENAKRVSKEYSKFWEDHLAKTFEGESQHFEVPFYYKDGSISWREIYLNPISDDKGIIIEASCIAHDISEMKNAEEQIRIQAAKMNSIIESSSHMIWSADKNGILTSFNKNQFDWQKRTYGIEPYVGMTVFEGSVASTEQYNNFWRAKFSETFSGQPQYFETQFLQKNGQISWLEVYLNPIKNESDEVIELSCIAHDITDKKLTDEKIRQSLKEKEVLLKEVHHRVKNNLQVISSILNLQSSYVRDKKMLELLHESRNRIKSMAFVHESLYQTKDFSNINFKEYIENISRNLLHSYANPQMSPELNLDLAEIQLNLDTAVPCGLIVNELLSNAFKYAFKDGRKGRIDVKLREKHDQITLLISDNGPGLPETVDYRQTESLGLQLVVTLVEQINGKIKLENKKGAKFTIEFTGQVANP